MRSFPLPGILIFLFFYLILTTGAYFALKTISKSNKKTIRRIYWFYNLVVGTMFVFLYIYPNQTRDATNYTFYLYFNTLLFADFIIKLILSLLLTPYLIFIRTKAKMIFLWAGFIFSVGIAVNIIFGVTIGNRVVRTGEYFLEYDNLPPEFENFKIVQFSDIHLKGIWGQGFLRKIQKDIDELNPDLLVFTGDMVNNFAYETSGTIDIFRQMTSKVPSYSILGNHDYGDYTDWDSEEAKQENFESLLQAQQDMGFNLLRNESVTISQGSDSLFLIGVENWGHPPFQQYADMDKAMQGIPGNAFAILLTHDPAHWESNIKHDDRINLSLSGHTHGLQWGIKPAGIPFSLSYLVRENWGGLYESSNSKLIVNTGQGEVGIPWRIEMPPELSVIVLKRNKID